MIRILEPDWDTNPRWKGIRRPYNFEEVLKLRGTIQVEHTLAKIGTEKLWKLLNEESYVPALGAITGNQAVQMVAAGLKAIYASGWQVAADGNMETYPDQSLYPADAVPKLVKRINNSFVRADQIQHSKGKNDIDWFAPIISDAEAGFGGVLNAFELMKAMIEAGAAAVHFEDQLSSAKKCGHMGGKVVVPVQEFIKKLIAARLATDVLGVPTIIIARTDANSASFLASNIDKRDWGFIVLNENTEEGFFKYKGGIDAAIMRGLAYAPYADMLWCETSKPDLAEAKKFAEAIRKKFPGKLLAYNCSPSCPWKIYLDDATIAKFQKELGEMGYKFQFVTLAGFHILNTSMFSSSLNYKKTGMAAYVKIQEAEFNLERKWNYGAVKHQEFVGTGYFDEVAMTIDKNISTLAMKGATENDFD